MHVLFIGIAISLLLTEITGISPGGVVATGYLSLFAFQPDWLFGTLLAAIVTYGMLRLAESRLLLYGRRQFAMYILTGIAVSQLASRLIGKAGMWDFGILIIGYLIPGLIARDYARQGIAVTTLVMALAIAMTRLIVLAGEGLLW